MVSKVSDPLFSVLLLPTLQSPRWKDFTLALRTFCENCHKYIAYLEEKAAVVQRNNRSPSPIRSMFDGKSSNQSFVAKAGIRKPCIIACYKALEEQLLKDGEYGNLVFLNDFAPRSRYVYLHEISLPFKIEVYTYHALWKQPWFTLVCLAGSL